MQKSLFNDLRNTSYDIIKKKQDALYDELFINLSLMSISFHVKKLQY